MATLLYFERLPWMRHVYEQLLNNVFSSGVVDRSVDREVITAFFGAAQELLTVDSWQFAVRVCGHVVLLCLGLLAISWLCIHPRTKLIVEIVGRTIADSAPSLVVYSFLFLMLAAVDYSTFGSVADGRLPLSSSLSLQIQRLVGSRILDHRHPSLLRLWLHRAYVVVFLFIFLWAIFGIFLALVANTARAMGRRSSDDVTCTGGFLQDVGTCFRNVYLWRAPGGRAFRQFTHDISHSSPGICRGEFIMPRATFGSDMSDLVLSRLDEFLDLYNARCAGSLLLSEDSLKQYVPPFVDIPYLDEALQVELRSRLQRTTQQWLAWACQERPCFEQVGTMMACSLVQEALYVLQRAGAITIPGVPAHDVGSDDWRKMYDRAPPGFVLHEHLPSQFRVHDRRRQARGAQEEILDSQSVVSELSQDSV